MGNLRFALVSCLMTVALGSLAASSSSSSLASSSLARTSIHEGLNTMVLRAREWLRTHENPDEAGMEELKATNPDAYAIVQALMTKKSLGLLNPRHPNAFGGYQDAPGSKGTMSTVTVEAPPQMAAVSTETQVASHSDFFNWKPHDDDDAMVANIDAPPSPVAKVAPSSPVETAQPQPVAQKSEPLKAAAPVEGSNSYLSSTGPLVKSPLASMSQENSYLNSAGLEPKQAVPVNTHFKTNALASFNWNDDDDSAHASVPAASKPTIPAGNALANFLR